MSIIKLSITILFLLTAFSGWATPTIHFNGTQNKIELSRFVDELEDPNKAFTIHEVVNNFSHAFQKNQKPTLNYNFSNSAYWLRFSLINKTSNNQVFYIKNKVAWVDSIQFFQSNKLGDFSYSESGSNVFLDNRAIQHRTPTFSVELKPLEEATYYLRVESQDAILLPLFLMTEKAYINEDKFINYFVGFVVGTVLIMILFYGFVYKEIKDKLYLWYTLYVFCYGINFLVINNLFFPSINTTLSYWHEFFHVAPLALYFIFIILFTIRFLNIKELFPKLNLSLNLLIVLLTIGILSYFLFSYRFSVIYNSYMATFIPFILIGVGFYCYYQKVALSHFYILAWVPNCLFFLVFAAAFHGVISYNNFTGFSNDIGMLIEVILLALVLIYRVKMFKNTQVQEPIITQEQFEFAFQMNVSPQIINKLEKQIDPVIEERIHELEVKNRELESLSRTDTLTGLFNRRELDNVLISNTKLAERYNISFGIILLDLDNFKHINDEHGHLIGDEILKKTAKILTNNTRWIDIVGRWGGEEFLIICPNYIQKDMIKTAEKLCLAIHQESLLDDIPFTASFGVAVHTKDETPKKIITRVDKALYTSKNNGKNQFSFAK